MTGSAHAQRGGGRGGFAPGGFAAGGYRGGYAAGYRGGYYGAYGGFRYGGYPYRYGPYGVGIGWVGVGVPLFPYVPYYIGGGDSTAFAPGSAGYSSNVLSPSASMGSPPPGDAGEAPPSTQFQNAQPPAPDNAAHLMLLVPDNAQIWFEGQKTSQTGKQREFITPVLEPGKSYTYTIRVRATSSDGRPTDETRDIRVRANDWWSIDFTKPAPKMPRTDAPAASTQGQ
jgi:uncharacterized protein (TIGR03000 family)